MPLSERTAGSFLSNCASVAKTPGLSAGDSPIPALDLVMFNPLRELNTYRFSGRSGAHNIGRVRSVGPIRNVLTGEPWSRSQKSCPCLAFVESQHFAIIFRSESTKHSRRLVCQHRSYGRGREPGPKCPGRGEGRELEWNVCPGERGGSPRRVLAISPCKPANPCHNCPPNRRQDGAGGRGEP